jgi:hypothetical protein
MALTKAVVCFLSIAAAGSAAFAGDLQPRRELGKPAVVAQPAHPHRLIVKFRDPVRARSTAQGLVSLADVDLSAINVIERGHGVRFSQVINLPQAKLDFLEQRAARTSGVAQPDLAGMMIAHAPDDRLQQVANDLNALDLTEFVSFQEMMPPPPCDDISPVTPIYNAFQGYHGPNPGLNMTAAWSLGNTRGAGIKIADCEYGYNANHEDLCNIIMEPGQTIHPDVIAYGFDEHGTAVFGELIGLDNDYGCIGLVPEAEALFFTEWSFEESFRRVTAIANALASVDAGDIVVLEMQELGPGGDYGPAELEPAVWTLVKNGTDAGIIVVAAAGNGAQDLDSPVYQEYRDRGDSGAIIVGAGGADTLHARLSFSTYGSRVNVQGWGDWVFTLGYGDYAEHGGDKNQRYISYFGGTSSATPLVAAACAAIQGLAEENSGIRLSPVELRDLLMETGIPQGGGGGHIGPFPNVLSAATVMLVHNVPADHATIQLAIDAASDGETIVVAPGTYPETIDLLGKAVTVRSSGGAQETTIDGQGNGSVVTCAGGEGPDTVLEGFTITGGTGTDPGIGGLCGGGMYVAGGSSATVTGCTFTGNTAEWGGGLYNLGTATVVAGSVFCGNTPDNIDGDPIIDGGGNCLADACGDINGNGVQDECECLGDINGDGEVGINDFLWLLSDWGPCGDCPSDLDADGMVGVVDFLKLLARWGPCA